MQYLRSVGNWGRKLPLGSGKGIGRSELCRLMLRFDDCWAGFREEGMLEIDGRCHCGRVTYEAKVNPASVRICHCVDCQSLTGSAYRVTVRAAREHVVITSGAPKVYKRFGDNGRKRLQLFCDECGSPLFTTGEGEDAAVWGIRWGSITQRQALAPSSQIWRRSAADWVDSIEHLPAHDKD